MKFLIGLLGFCATAFVALYATSKVADYIDDRNFERTVAMMNAIANRPPGCATMSEDLAAGIPLEMIQKLKPEVAAACVKEHKPRR